MAGNKVIGKVVTKASFSVDSRSRQQLKKFEDRLKKLRDQMDGVYGKGKGPSQQQAAFRKTEASKTKAILTEEKKREKIRNRVAAAEFQVGRAGVKGEAFVQFRRDLARISREYKNTTMSAAEYNGKVSRLVQGHKDAARATRTFGGEMRSLRRTVVNATAAYTAFSGIANVAQTGFGLEATESILEGVTGSTKAAREEMQFLRDTARQFGVDLTQSGKGYGKLIAAGKESNITMEDTKNLFLATSKASAAFGLTADETNGLILAFQQIISKGQVMS